MPNNDFLSFDTYVYNKSTYKYVLTDEDRWTDAKDENFAGLNGAHQDQDRPGYTELPKVDADNLYGFDSAYASCSKYSMGYAEKFTADATYGGAVNFSFY